MTALLRFFLENKLVVALTALLLAAWGVRVAPFDWDVPGVPRDPVPVDAIPDTGENQQIVFTTWPGRSPQDVEDQITYPLTVALLGVAGVESIRSTSMFGFSTIFVIFDEDVDFYWSRSRLLEKLSSLPDGALPPGVQPALGPDATALGQVFWYTLEGRTQGGAPAGGWDLAELRSVQDWTVRYALSGVEGVAEVASIGGYVREYQIDVDPDAMRAYGVTLGDVFGAVAASNVDVGARTIEVNRAEYVVRGLGLIESTDDVEATVVGVADNVPVTIGHIANVSMGPALRRGALDKGGVEAAGGVVVVRFGANPLEVIERVKAKIAEIEPGLPSKVLSDGTTSKLTVVPFYDRSGLIRETLGTLESALLLQILVTIVVVVAMVAHLRSALLVSGLVPLAVLGTFVAMRWADVDANVVALAGIAIAIGTMVDVGIVMTENVLNHVAPGQTVRERFDAILRASSEVGSAVVTAVATTVVGFLPVFTMEGAEGKLFKPLAYTKTFALLASIVVGIVIIPPAAHVLLGRGRDGRRRRRFLPRVGERTGRLLSRGTNAAVAIAVALVLADLWEPLGPERDLGNVVFTAIVVGGVLLGFALLLRVYEPMLRWCLAHKALFLAGPTVLTALGLVIWLGWERVAGTVGLEERWAAAERAFPGLGREFMPPLDEGSFLLMPVTMAHASIGEALDMLQEQDARIAAIPEVEDVVGKIGRVESALDPAPISMVETVITYVPEYASDASGRRLLFAYDDERGAHVRDARGLLVPDEDGRPFRQWRDAIETPRDIWNEVERAARMPGMTTASMLQPIETRRIMLQTGMRAPMGIKVFGPDLETIERVALDFERFLGDVPSVRPETVLADRVIGKPYLEIDIDRDAIARYGLSVRAVQDVIEVAVGGRTLTTTIEGRERYPVRVRYQRELRDRVEELDRILVGTRDGVQVPLGQLAEVRYTRGPQAIKSEGTFLVAHVLFDGRPDVAEVEVVEQARAHLEHLVESGAYELPPGVSYRFAGEYENQVRATETLRVVLPLSLFVIFVILYLQFRSTLTTAMVFSAVLVAWSGGFLMLWLYGEPWFLDAHPFGVDLRELLGVRPTNLSVAVWVGFLALFGIATDDGVLMATYLRQRFDADQPRTRHDVREAVVAAGLRRIRPCLMTTATTLLALLPVLTSRGRGADVLVPMAIPVFGGMVVALLTIFVVPTLWSAVEERRARVLTREHVHEAGSA